MKQRADLMLATTTVLVVVTFWGVSWYAADAPGGGYAGLWILLWLSTGLMGMIGLVWSMVRWRATRWWAIVPLSIAITGWFGGDIARRAGQEHKYQDFLADLPAYETIIADVRSGTRSEGALNSDSFPSPIRGCCYLVTARRDSTGTMYAQFWTEHIPFRPGHAGWLYTDLDSMPRGWLRGGGWAYAHQVAPHWYFIAD